MEKLLFFKVDVIIRDNIIIIKVSVYNKIIRGLYNCINKLLFYCFVLK